MKGVTPGQMNSEEILAFWKQKGLFETAWPQYADIGPGKRFADSTEYVQHLRQQPMHQGK